MSLKRSRLCLCPTSLRPPGLAVRVNSGRGEVRLEGVCGDVDALFMSDVGLLEEHVDERVGQRVSVSADPFEIHSESTALNREGKGRGEKSLDHKAVALVVRDPGDGELRSSEVRGGGVVVKRVSNSREQFWPEFK